MSKKDEFEKERQNLKDFINSFFKNIYDLKMNIGLVGSKGEHIYTKVTSNIRNFS
jgi:hypothetical protein